MRLIDADRLLTDRMKSKYYHLPNGDIAIPLIDVEHAPTIDPDLSSYSDKLWRNAYERGKAEAEVEIIYCKDCVHHINGFFCRQANHHTSDNDCCASVFGAERRTNATD